MAGALLCVSALLPRWAQTPKPVTIAIHADQPTGVYKAIRNFFGADEPNYLYAPNGQNCSGTKRAESGSGLFRSA